jgi:hypothetical protein
MNCNKYGVKLNKIEIFQKFSKKFAKKEAIGVTLPHQRIRDKSITEVDSLHKFFYIVG